MDHLYVLYLEFISNEIDELIFTNLANWASSLNHNSYLQLSKKLGIRISPLVCGCNSLVFVEIISSLNETS